jgi:hypothetical protein
MRGKRHPGGSVLLGRAFARRPAGRVRYPVRMRITRLLLLI